MKIKANFKEVFKIIFTFSFVGTPFHTKKACMHSLHTGFHLIKSKSFIFLSQSVFIKAEYRTLFIP